MAAGAGPVLQNAEILVKSNWLPLLKRGEGVFGGLSILLADSITLRAHRIDKATMVPQKL